MVDTLGFTNAVGGSPAYSGRMLRQSGSAAFSGATAARPLGARSGVRPGTSVTTVTATSTTWTCGPFAGVADVEAAAEAGPYTFAFDAATSGSVTAADASNARTDLIYVQIDDPSESDGSTVPAATRKYLAGTAGVGAPVPATPARSFVVAKINVPVLGGGSPTVTWAAPYAVGAGGVLPVASSVEYPASPVKGQYADDAALGGLVRFNGSTWDQVGTDTGWVNVTTTAPHLFQGGTAAQVRRIGKRVQMKWGWAGGTMTASGAFNVGVIPVGFRPPQTQYGATGTNSAPTTAQHSISSAGVVTVKTGTIVPDYVLFDNVSWLID